jgi:uncharacterized protein (DUF2062 family)
MITRIKTKMLRVLKTLLQKGMSVRKISLSIAFGIVLGIFPVLGTTTLLCTIAAFIFRLNFPAIQVVNYVVYPLQIFLLAPFYALGSWLFSDRSPMIEESIIDMLKNDFWGSMVNLWDLTLYAVFSWVIISPLLILMLYVLLRPVIRSMASSGGRVFSLHSEVTGSAGEN